LFNEKNLNNLLKSKKVHYPVMLKSSGHKPSFEHKMAIILSDRGMHNFCKKMSNQDVKEKKFICQNYVNHGGYLLKVYRIKQKNYFYFRPSTPDVDISYEETREDYINGYFDFETELISNSNYLDFWNSHTNNGDIKTSFDQKFIEEITEEFEIYSGNTLFGLDFIFDPIKKTLLLIDCNYFPGYKELAGDISNILSDHVLLYYSKFVSENKEIQSKEKLG